MYFPKSKAIRGRHCYLCHTELHYRTHRKVFGGRSHRTHSCFKNGNWKGVFTRSHVQLLIYMLDPLEILFSSTRIHLTGFNRHVFYSAAFICISISKASWKTPKTARCITTTKQRLLCMYDQQLNKNSADQMQEPTQCERSLTRFKTILTWKQWLNIYLQNVNSM